MDASQVTGMVQGGDFWLLSIVLVIDPYLVAEYPYIVAGLQERCQ